MRFPPPVGTFQTPERSPDTSHFTSGDTETLNGVSACCSSFGSAPSMFISQSLGSPERSDRKATEWPSLVGKGAQLLPMLAVSCFLLLPSDSMIHISSFV